MINKSIGFVGGGRVVRIILSGLKRAGYMLSKIIVSDSNIEVLNKLKIDFPEIKITQNNVDSARNEIIFFSLHPTVINGVLNEIRFSIDKNSAFISFAPKVSIKKLSENLNGLNKVIRMIPNAPSIINKGYNPVCFSSSFSEKEKNDLLEFFNILGKCPEVKEENLEAYAILSAMGPTYLWFQLYELMNLGASFGLSEDEIRSTIPAMIEGTVKTIFESGLSPDEVIDLIPVKPLGDEEENIKNIYRSKLNPLYKKLKGNI